MPAQLHTAKEIPPIYLLTRDGALREALMGLKELSDCTWIVSPTPWGLIDALDDFGVVIMGDDMVPELISFAFEHVHGWQRGHFKDRISQWVLATTSITDPPVMQGMQAGMRAEHLVEVPRDGEALARIIREPYEQPY